MTNTRTKEAIINDILKLFTENEELFNDCIEELDGYNGYLGDDRYYSMDELDEFYRGTNPTELLQRVYFGYDEDDVVIDEWGEEHRKEFNPMKDYFRYNGYGNLVSNNYKDYTSLLDEYFVDALLQYRQEVYSIEDDARLVELLDELEAAEEE